MVNLAFSTAPIRDTVFSGIKDFLETNPPKSVISQILIKTVDEKSRPAVMGDVDFESSTLGDYVFDYIKTLFAGVLLGSSVTIHDCTHDESAPKPCKITAQELKA